MSRKALSLSISALLATLALCPGRSQAQTPNYVPLWLDSVSQGDSVIYQTTDGKIGIGTENPEGKLHLVEGNAFVRTEMSSSGLPFFSFRGPEVHGSPGRLSLYGSSGQISSNLHYDSASAMWVQDNPAYPSAALGAEEGLIDLSTAPAGVGFRVSEHLFYQHG